MLTQSLAGLPAFLSYFAAAIGLLALFLLTYILITPYREIALIREGNSAAALSLGGVLVGLAIPLSASLAGSTSALEIGMWGAACVALQLLIFRLVDLALHGLPQRIAEAEAVLDDRERHRRVNEIRKLTLPGEMGERFQVMGFTRDVDLSAAFAFGELSRRL